MEHVLSYNVYVCENFFCASFINSKTNKQTACYVLDKDQFNTSVLFQIINNCTLVGYNNTLYDNVILNYISHNKAIDIREIYSLATAINESKDVTRDEDLNFYVNRNVYSFDLKETSSIDNILKYEQISINKPELDLILLECMQYAQKVQDALKRTKQVLNDGYAFSYNKVTSESIRRNYILKILQI